MTIINAFHPDYVKTYHPELLSSIKLESAQVANGQRAGGAFSKATRENVNADGASAVTINKFPKTKSARSKLLDVTVFHTYSKAGTANTTKKKKAK